MSGNDHNLSRLELLGVVEELRKTVKRQQQRIEELEKMLAGSRKNSSNSSKPPSSDIVKPEPDGTSKAESNKRKRAGQPGHPISVHYLPGAFTNPVTFI